MTRRLRIPWPDPRPFESRGGSPIRLLAVSDDIDPALEHAVNREALGMLDAVVGAGDLEPAYLSFLGDAFGVPVMYVRGNHDRGGQWAATTADHAPRPLASGKPIRLSGLTVVPFEWPGLEHERAVRDEWRAWIDVTRAEASLIGDRLRGRGAPLLVLSHAPPRGVGDAAADPYHVGYAAYRWLLDRHRPPLWLHGHTTLASVVDWREDIGESTVANVTGSILVELVPPAAAGGNGERALRCRHPLVDAAEPPAQRDERDAEGDRERADEPHDRQRPGGGEEEHQHTEDDRHHAGDRQP